MLLREPVLATVPEVAICPLARFPEEALLPGDDMTASLCARLGEAVAVLSFEPDDAHALLQAALPADAPDPLAGFTEVGARLIERLAAAALGGTSLPAVSVELVEDSLAAILLRTHAPPDTQVICARLAMAGERDAWGGVLYLLMEPKQLARVAPATAAA